MKPARAAKLARAVEVLRAGGVVAYPTEAVYGIGCDPWRESALERIAAIKRRSLDKGFILVGADSGQLAPFVRPDWVEWVERRLGGAPPRPSDPPVTWLVPARASVPGGVTGEPDGADPKVAIRVTGHPVAQALCRGLGGAIVSTSANTAGARPARSALAVRLRLGRRLDLVVPGPTGGHSRPSAIRDAASGRTLRE